MIVILDIETQELVPESHNLESLQISLAGLRIEKEFFTFTEQTLHELFKILDDAELIVGYNLFRFDYKVLERYLGASMQKRYGSKTFDMQHCLLKKTDRLIPLNDVAKRNLGIEKSGSGKDAPQLYREGKIDELRTYLAQDLLVTQLLFEHIRDHGRVKYGLIMYKDPIEREVVIHITDR